jgi:DNA-binding GntR family transcriptional regulator
MMLEPQEDAEEELIVDKIYEAVLDQRLGPGTKLSEVELCEAFGVGRMRIRRSLLLLASREVVELLPNRGAFVAKPTAQQAADTFEARLIMEPPLLKMLLGRAQASDLAQLEQHLQDEANARESGKRREAIRLSGLFHTHIAQLAGNTVMMRAVKDLVARSSLIIGLYGDPGLNICRDDEHTGIIEALQAKDADQAQKLMVSHLEHLKEHLDLGPQKHAPKNLVELFSTETPP